jgi:kanamycin kinase
MSQDAAGAPAASAFDSLGRPVTSEVSAADVPAMVRRLAGPGRLRPVWRNELGGLTFELTDTGGSRRFVKWVPSGSGLDLASEVVRLRWVAGRLPVPQVLDHGCDRDGEWLVTAALPGENAVVPRWTADPATAVRALGTGLRRLHDVLPVADCPYSWSVSTRLAGARRRGAPARDEPQRWLDEAPPVDRLVVCAGDACAPNTLLDDFGRVTGHVDLGSLGVADRWADLAVATWSTVWNYGPGWERPLLDAYGVDPDPARTDFYRRLWDATS